MAEGLGFARKELEKHGWEEGFFMTVWRDPVFVCRDFKSTWEQLYTGKGLGKEETGITKAIKVGIKNDTRGVGYDMGEQFTFHWWDHIFNKTAKSIVVKETEDGVEVSKGSISHQPVSSKRPNKYSQKPLIYGRFVKASSTATTSMGHQSDSDSEAEKDFSSEHPEDKVFQACGGRTAHKAARHGLKLSGKLLRIEQQEREALSAPCSRSGSPDVTQEQGIEGNTPELLSKLKTRKNKSTSKKREKSYSDSEDVVVKRKKKRKNKGCNYVNEIILGLEIPKKKKQKRTKDGSGECIQDGNSCTEVCEKKRSKKRKEEKCDELVNYEKMVEMKNDQSLQQKKHGKVKKKKKRKEKVK